MFDEFGDEYPPKAPSPQATPSPPEVSSCLHFRSFITFPDSLFSG